jgi:hypothetical protein
MNTVLHKDREEHTSQITEKTGYAKPAYQSQPAQENQPDGSLQGHVRAIKDQGSCPMCQPRDLHKDSRYMAESETSPSAERIWRTARALPTPIVLHYRQPGSPEKEGREQRDTFWADS